MPIAVKPLGVAMSQQPLSRDNRQTTLGKAHRLAHTHEAIDRSYFGQHMRRVSSLALPWLEPPLFFKNSEHGIQQHLLCSPVNQALAKVGQDGEIKAGISQF